MSFRKFRILYKKRRTRRATLYASVFEQLPPKSKSFARGLQSTKPVANDRREFAIAIAKQNKIFKVCGFTYTLRQFFAPVFAHECQCYHRLVVTLLPTEREARSGSTRKSDSSKSKRDAQGVPFTFWWNRRELNPCPKTS